MEAAITSRDLPMASATRKSGEFFAVDSRIWAQLCGSGTTNEAVSYLVLAQGSGGDNRTTSWSATSLKTYAGISWERAKLAINSLISSGFVRLTEASTTLRPRYELISWAELTQRSLDQYERLVLSEIKRGNARPRRSDRAVIKRLADKQLIREQHSGEFSVIESAAANEKESLIWLPNALITGTVKAEESPVRRLRRSGDVWTLRLLVDLYASQNLRDDGGISPLVLRSNYDRKRIGEQGIFTVWAFRPRDETFTWTTPR